MPKITEMWAYIACDKDEDDEGIPAFHDGIAWHPLVGADSARAESLKAQAREVAFKIGKPLRLVRFTNLEEIEVIKP